MNDKWWCKWLNKPQQQQQQSVITKQPSRSTINQDQWHIKCHMRSIKMDIWSQDGHAKREDDIKYQDVSRVKMDMKCQDEHN